MKVDVRSAGRLLFLCAMAAASLAVWSVRPSVAQGLEDRIIDSAANTIVSQIQSESCADFAASLRKTKSGGSNSRTSRAMKNNPAARTRFINKVAGPLVNKMIDCDLLPGR